MAGAVAEPWPELASVPARPHDSHKGDFGRVLVVAGSRAMPGAAAMVGKAAQRIGAGLVTVACPEPARAVVASYCPTLMTLPLRTDGWGAVARTAAPRLVGFRADVLAVGPGLTTGTGAQTIVRLLVQSRAEPMVLDADGLNALIGAVELLHRRPGPTILTPHPGEFARLVGVSIAEVQAERVPRALAFAQHYGVVLVLKGAGTIVTDGRRLAVNATGNPYLATGGSGDVLTGMVAGLLAQGLEPAAAARLAVHLHGRLADHLARRQAPLIATDLIDALPEVFGADPIG